MKRKFLLPVLLLLVLTTATFALALGGGLSIPRFSINGGGAAIQGGDFELFGVIAQPDAGVLSGGVFVLAGGFGAGAPADGRQEVYLPMITR